MPDAATPERRLARLPDAATDTLIELYEQAARLLRSMIGNAIRRGALGDAEARRRQLAAVRRALAQLEQDAQGLAALSVLAGYEAGAIMADRGIQDLTSGLDEVLARAFVGANRRQVQVLALAADRKLESAIRSVGRATDDLFRRIGIQEVGLGSAAGFETRVMTARIASRLTEEGLTAFVDRAGRRWKLDTYAEMVARTTQREAATVGTVDRLREVGFDLVTISAHLHPCDLCTRYDGNTYSLSGHSERFPRISAFPPFHPNCRHVLTAAAENLPDLLPQAA